MSIVKPTVTSDIESVSVIPLDGSRGNEGIWELRLPPTSAAEKAISHLKSQRDQGRVVLSDEAIEQIARSAVQPSDIANASLLKQRTEHGWLWTLETRIFTPLANVAYANDRMLGDAMYEADPTASVSTHSQISMPEAAIEESALWYREDDGVLLPAADRNFEGVLSDNRQDVGVRLIERPLTLVATRRAGDPQLDNGFELTTVDGNCRLSSALARLSYPTSLLPKRLQEGRSSSRLMPSTLMNMSFAERRKFTRELIKWYSAELDQGRSAESRNVAAMAINSLTIPAEIIVGYTDDRDSRQERFASAVRGLLLRMNVSVKPFEDGSKHAVIAEEIAVGLHDVGVISTEALDVLVGRSNVAAGMAALGLDASIPDLRAAVVVRELTRNESSRNSVLRAKMSVPAIHLKHRNGPIVELALRSYTSALRDPSANRPADPLARVRQALGSAPLWQDLVSSPWEVTNVSSDADIDELTQKALRDSQGPDARYLGVLGLFALVTTGHLLAPGGSAETQISARVDRGSIGSIISKMLGSRWGTVMLGDAIKRSRAGSRLRMWSDEAEKLTDFAESKSLFNARLRQRVLEGSEPDPENTPENRQAAAADNLYKAIADTRERMLYLVQVREEEGITDRLHFYDAEVSLNTLTSVRDRLAQITTPGSL